MTLTCDQKPQKSCRFSSTGWFLIHSCDRLSVVLILPLFSNSARKKSIAPTLPPNERVDLVVCTFSDPDELGMLEYLVGNDAQTFIDVIDEGSVHILVLIESR